MGSFFFLSGVGTDEQTQSRGKETRETEKEGAAGSVDTTNTACCRALAWVWQCFPASSSSVFFLVRGRARRNGNLLVLLRDD